MKFTQALDEENARFENAKAQHEQACLQAKITMLERIVEFAQGHFIGEVLVDEPQRTIAGDWKTYISFCTDTTSFLGRYFATNGKPTNRYLLMERKKTCPSHFYWSTCGEGTETKSSTALCFEEENPTFLEALTERVRTGYVTPAIREAPNPIFSFRRREDITTKWNRAEQNYDFTREDSGNLAGITSIELGMNVEDYTALVDSLHRRQAEIKK